MTDFQFWFYVGMVLFLTLMAGLMSGLTLGLMSLDSVELEVGMVCGVDPGLCLESRLNGL